MEVAVEVVVCRQCQERLADVVAVAIVTVDRMQAVV
jgi:hypothetical protein